MIFRRHPSHLNYFLPIDTTLRTVVFTENNIPEFSLADAIAGRYPQNYLLIFFKDKVDFSPEAKATLLEKARAGTRVYWLDDFSGETVSSAAYIYLDKNTVLGFSSLGVGNSDPNIQLLHRAVQGTIALDAAKTSLQIKPAAGKAYDLSAHGFNSKVESINIPLGGTAAKTGKFTMRKGGGTGSLNFQVQRKGILELVQPVSPFYIDKNNSASPRAVQVFYFDKNSYNANAEVFVSLQPYRQVANAEDTFSSYMETKFNNDTGTNFSDDKGGQFLVAKKSALVSRVASLEYIPGDRSTKRFFFIPAGGESLDLKPDSKNAQQLLTGFSGTEAFGLEGSGAKITFRETADARINKSAGTLEPNGDSKTSLLEIDKRNYSLDSEGAPLFLNNTLEPKYEFVQRAKLSKSGGIPVIPTFSFRGNTDLEELETVFRKVRLRHAATHLKSKKFLTGTQEQITPQGFLRKGNSYDLIRNEAKLAKKKSAVKGLFQFNITDNGQDLDLSIRKDEVFFVLTPGLFKQYGNALLEARFAINRSSNAAELFQLDMTSLFMDASADQHDNSVIIFKFHKKPFKDLLKDTTLWSNNGDGILGNQSSLKHVLRVVTENKLLDIDDPYFTGSILEDPNWNGVVVLNVPIGDSENLPKIFSGLSNSQQLNKGESNQKLALKTALTFKYVAFPVNKTEISGSAASIASTSFYGMIDYNPFENDDDYKEISKHFDNTAWKFILSKLKVRFANSKIAFFEAFSFLQVNKLFEDSVDFEPFMLTHGDDGRTDEKRNLVRLKGHYQKNGDDTGVFMFDAELNGKIKFGPDAILKAISVSKIGFCYDSGPQEFRFDIDASAEMNDWSLSNFISIKKIDFSNIGLNFKFDKIALPKLNFDLSKLFVLPQIDFNCEGFLSSFPIRFSHFKGFKLKKIAGDKIDIDYDFFTFKSIAPNIDIGLSASFFSFIFDFDLGTLGNLAALKALKGQLLFGWSFKGGFAMGLKIAGPSTDGFHVDLFGALKLDIQKVEFCEVGKQYVLRLVNARLTVLGMELPPEGSVFSALMFAGKGSKLAWLMSYVSGTNADVTKNKLRLGIGQRVSVPDLPGITNVDEAITAVKRIFDPKLDCCDTGKFPQGVYAPDHNWLVASENFIPDKWKEVFDLKLIFNDPTLYGVFLRIVGLLDIDILYKKVSDNLGVWALEVAPDPSIRNIEMGGASVTLPNLGVEIYTNGDWRGDIGYPRSTNDWSRSCLVQIRPFVGWGGFYIARLRNAALSLFADYVKELPKDPRNSHSEPGDGVSIIQAGFAFRIGIGAYIDKGIFYVGASISVYGIMEGAFAFNISDRGAKQLFPDHFALRGRIGAIAELIGYVDFKIIKAAVHIILRIEFGMLLALINGKLKPVPIYIEGEVRVRVSVTICCFRVFRKKICIVLHFSFRATVRFPYTIGGDSQRMLAIRRKVAALAAAPITVALGEIPVIYVPGVSKTGERGNQLVHQFAIMFFGCRFDGPDLKFSEKNILKDNIIRPIFDAVLRAGLTSYLEIREAFLEGPEGSNTPFVVTSFKPVLLVGFNGLTERAFLKSHFLFSDPEIDSFIALGTTADCSAGTGNCPYRMVPAPMVSAIKVLGSDGTRFETDARGFSIEADGIFADAAGNPAAVKLEVKREEKYTDDQLSSIDKHFDGYFTQFVDRSKSKKAAAALKDIREDAILPEYIKLIGLLTLEAYYNFLTDDPANREKRDFNPVITLNELFSETGAWKFNEHLEGIIGQLNYFYNNGLRLPDLTPAGTTKAYYEALQLSSPIGGIVATPDDKLADIRISKNGTADFISLKGDMFADNSLGDYLDRARKHLRVDFEALKREFSPAAAESPYVLAPLRIHVANSFTNTQEGSKAIRFFEVPACVAQHFKTADTALNLFSVKNEDNSETPQAFIPCIHVEAKAKPHQVAGKTKVAELINVFATDLIRMHKVNDSGITFQRVHIYLKTTDSNGAVQLLPLVVPGEEAKTRLVRTNLSPRTHPPVIIENVMSLKDRAAEQYIAPLSDQPAFIRLLWEALVTNNGGFHLVESPASSLFAQMVPENGGKKVLEYTLVFSFESAAGQPFSAIHNQLKVTDSNALFQQLDDSKYSLLANVLKPVTKGRKPKAATLEPMLEYHAKLPAHCFSFSIARNTPDVALGHDRYLPVEFGITGDPEITKDKVLPLMPLEKTDEATGQIIAGKLFYTHVTPLHKVADEANKNRYQNIGKSFNLKFGVRDTYGFRAVNLDTSLNYHHIYFDKLMPVSAWPLIECSWWFGGFRSNELTFDLSIRAFHDGQVISDEEKPEIRKALHTAIAQLTDAKVTVSMNYTVSENLKPLFLQFLEHALNNLDKPVKKSKTVQFKIKADGDFKKSLDPKITISRPADDSLYPVLAEDVWDKALLRTAETPVVAGNPAERRMTMDTGSVLRKDTLQPLNNAIAGAAGCPYALGLGNNEDGEKLLYLVRVDYIRAITYTPSPLPRTRYFGIMPYSNELYAGKYTPVMPGSAAADFTNIDLDKGLSLVLARIDALLSPGRIPELGIPDSTGTLYVQKLIAAKKALVESELKNKTDNIDKATADAPQETMRKELRDALLDRLSNFYGYDGIIDIAATVPANILPKLKEYRLTVETGKDNRYAIVSSKLDFAGGQPKWAILFDQLDDAEHIELTFTPEITHLETDIVPMGGEIEKSAWIQLVAPVKLSAPVSTAGHTDPRKKWPFIRRVFPPKPTILEHRTEQMARTGKLTWTSATDLGKWKYILKLADPYKPGDQLDLNIRIRDNGMFRLVADARNFKGFIAYWSSRFDTTGYKDTDFIDDLFHQMQLALPDAKALAASEKSYPFSLEKHTTGWIKAGPATPFTATILQEAGSVTVVLDGAGFDIFQVADRITAVKPEIKALRNRRADNDRFVYKTDMVAPVVWAVPHVRFEAPIRLADTLTLQSVFNKISDINLPYKSTARFLLNTTDIDVDRTGKLPKVPLLQMQLAGRNKPAESPVDKLFDGIYKNGFPAVSITVFNDEENENSLPLFSAATIFKLSVNKKFRKPVKKKSAADKRKRKK